MRKTFICTVALLVGSVSLAQVKIGGTDATPNTHAMLDVESSNKGFLPPRVELQATNNASPLINFTGAAGITVYNTASAGAGATAVSPGYYYNDGTKWIRLINDAENGLHTQTGTVKLGGELTENTAITTGGATQTLAIENLVEIEVEERSDLDNQNIVLAHESTGVLKTVDAKTFALAKNNTILKAGKNGGWGLLNLTIGGNWRKINLQSSDVLLGSASLFNNGTYTIPESGVYVINFEIQLASGVNIEVLGGQKMAIFKNNNVAEEKYFDAVRVAISVTGLINVTLASIPVTSSNLDTMLRFEKDDELSFTLSESLLDVELLNSANVSIYLYKVSD